MDGTTQRERPAGGVAVLALGLVLLASGCCSTQTMVVIDGAQIVDSYAGKTGADEPFLRIFEQAGLLTHSPAAEVTLWRGAPFAIFNDTSKEVVVGLPPAIGGLYNHRVLVTIPAHKYLVLKVAANADVTALTALQVGEASGGSPKPIIKDPPSS